VVNVPFLVMDVW